MLGQLTWIRSRTQIISAQIDSLAKQTSKFSKSNPKWARSQIFNTKTSLMGRILAARWTQGLTRDYLIKRLVLKQVVRVEMTLGVSPASSKNTTYLLLRPEETLKPRQSWSSKRPKSCRWSLKRRLSKRRVNLTRMPEMLKRHSKFLLTRGSRRTFPCSTKWHSSRPLRCSTWKWWPKYLPRRCRILNKDNLQFSTAWRQLLAEKHVLIKSSNWVKAWIVKMKMKQAWSSTKWNWSWGSYEASL